MILLLFCASASPKPIARALPFFMLEPSNLNLPIDIVAKYAGLGHIFARSAGEDARPVEIARARECQKVLKNL